MLAVEGALGMTEEAREARKFLGVDAAAMILHLEEEIRLLHRYCKPDLAALGAELHRIGKQIVDDLAQEPSVCQGQRGVGGQVYTDIVTLVDAERLDQ